jgi:hypothetical protein
MAVRRYATFINTAGSKIENIREEEAVWNTTEPIATTDEVCLH